MNQVTAELIRNLAVTAQTTITAFKLDLRGLKVLTLSIHANPLPHKVELLTFTITLTVTL